MLNKFKFFFPFFFGFILLACSPVAAGKFAVAGIENDEEAIKYFNFIRKQVKQDRKTELANEILFPIKVYIDKSEKIVTSKKNFLNCYDLIMNNKIKQAILNQKEEDLFATWQGISTTGGEVWFGLVENETTGEWNFRIISINNL